MTARARPASPHRMVAPPAEMSEEQALLEARRRWGTQAAVHERPIPVTLRDGSGGRLARYRFTVGNNGLGKRCTVKGQGHSWQEAFDDADAQA